MNHICSQNALRRVLKGSTRRTFSNVIRQEDLLRRLLDQELLRLLLLRHQFGESLSQLIPFFLLFLVELLVVSGLHLGFAPSQT